MQGAELGPQLRRLLLSGTLKVKVAKATDLSVSSTFGKATV
jgi:hypothetical protein